MSAVQLTVGEHAGLTGDELRERVFSEGISGHGERMTERQTVRAYSEVTICYSKA